MVKTPEAKEPSIATPQTPNPQPPVLESKNTNVQHTKKSSWDGGRVFWGLLLVVIGGLALADNFGVVAVNWSNLWRLWPLLIVAAGLSLLSLSNLLWRVLSVILIVLSLAAAVFVALGDYSNVGPTHTQQQTVQRLSTDVKQAEVSIQAGASELRVNTVDKDAIVSATMESNVASLSQVTTRDGTTQRVELSMKGNSRWWIGDVRSTWQVDLTRRLPIRLTIDAGASDTKVDVSQAQLRAVTIKAGASSVLLRLGERENMTTTSIDAGASSIVVQIPKDSGVRLNLDSGLASKQLADLREVGDGTYESSGYDQSKKKIVINGVAGVSSFTIERY